MICSRSVPGAEEASHERPATLRLHCQVGKDSGAMKRVRTASESVLTVYVPAFDPDLDGRYLLCGSQSGIVNVADLVELRRRLTEVGLGW